MNENVTMYDVLSSIMKTRQLLSRLQQQALDSSLSPIRIADRIQSLNEASESLLVLKRGWSEPGENYIIDEDFDGPTSNISPKTDT